LIFFHRRCLVAAVVVTVVGSTILYMNIITCRVVYLYTRTRLGAKRKEKTKFNDDEK
jgi:hypothetical protein